MKNIKKSNLKIPYYKNHLWNGKLPWMFKEQFTVYPIIEVSSGHKLFEYQHLKKMYSLVFNRRIKLTHVWNKWRLSDNRIFILEVKYFFKGAINERSA